MTSGEGTEMESGSPSIMMPALKTPESSPTAGPIGGKALVAESPWFKYHLPDLKKKAMILDLNLLLPMPASSHM